MKKTLRLTLPYERRRRRKKIQQTTTQSSDVSISRKCLPPVPLISGGCYSIWSKKRNRRQRIYEVEVKRCFAYKLFRCDGMFVCRCVEVASCMCMAAATVRLSITTYGSCIQAPWSRSNPFALESPYATYVCTQKPSKAHKHTHTKRFILLQLLACIYKAPWCAQ